MLSEGELFTVSAIIPLLEQYKNTPLEASFKSIFQKITDMLPEEVSVNSAFAAGGIQFISDPLPNIDNVVFNTVFKAVKLHVSMDFLYCSLGKQEYTPRRLDPYQVICQKGNWYVIGYCHKAETVRIYSLARMKKISCTKKQFKVPDDFDIRKHVDPNFGVWNNPVAPVKVELLFAKEISTYILERTWHDGQKMKQNKDGSVYLSFKSNQMQETLFWVLHFGAAVKVLNPPELADRVKKEAKKILKSY
jgi:proteasome accessory factor B